MKRVAKAGMAGVWVVVGALALRAELARRDSVAMMTAAARHFVASLPDEQRAKAVFPFDGEVRLDWHYIPKANRKGLPFKAMTPEQVHLAHALLNAGLSARGYAKAATVMSLESLVRELEAAQGRSTMLALRDPFLYYLSIFGDPSGSGPWGWSVEGHHLSLNFTIVDGRAAATSPAFHGSEPHNVLAGARAGLRALGMEEDRARALLAALDEPQRRKTIVADQAPSDIFSAARRKVEFEGAPQGLPASEMNDAQKGLLMELVEEYVGNAAEDLQERRRERVRQSGEEIYFAWMGSTTPGIGQPHYYRVQGKRFLIEYDNIQNQANHSHTVWRDYDGDFGLDLLAQHHAEAHGAARAVQSAGGF